eukprot:EG_transcript_17490
MTLPSSSCATFVPSAACPGPYCHDPYAANPSVPHPPAAPVAEPAPRRYCHDPYALPHLGGQTWEETWSICMRTAGRRLTDVPRSPLRPSLPEPLSAISLSSSEESLHSGGDGPRSAARDGDAAPLSDRSPSAGGSESNASAQSDAGLPRGSGPLPTSRFPVTLESRCNHRAHWQRLRGKRGYTYYLCTKCQHGWRKLRGNQTPTEN